MTVTVTPPSVFEILLTNACLLSLSTVCEMHHHGAASCECLQTPGAGPLVLEVRLSKVSDQSFSVEYRLGPTIFPFAAESWVPSHSVNGVHVCGIIFSESWDVASHAVVYPLTDIILHVRGQGQDIAVWKTNQHILQGERSQKQIHSSMFVGFFVLCTRLRKYTEPDEL